VRWTTIRSSGDIQPKTSVKDFDLALIPWERQSGLNRLKGDSRLVHPALELNAVPEPYMAVTLTIGLPRACHTLADPREDALGLRLFFDGRLSVKGEGQYLIEARHDCSAWQPDGVKWLP
jgi:hypothetical protein